MTTFEAILLGLVQGLSEFLPVSSSGHLVLAQALLGLAQEGLVFEIVVHVATLVSVLAFYHRRVGSLIVGILRGSPEAWRYAMKLVVASLPAVAVVLLFGAFFEAQFESMAVVGLSLLLTGWMLWTTRRSTAHAELEEPSWLAALGIGCAQAFAILPGISRSGATVAAAIALGVRPVAAAEFSFMMSVVAITGAATRLLLDFEPVSDAQASALLWGGIVALLSGIGAIWLFVRLLRGQAFYRFAYYTWAVGGGILVWVVLG
jgi:undecaprenyl-diphosphatase